MLYTAVIGSKNGLEDAWDIVKDQYGNHFFSKDDIRQRIRIDHRVPIEDYPDTSIPSINGGFYTAYPFPTNVQLNFNQKNMNPILMTKKKDDEIDPLIIYLVVSSATYQIVEYAPAQDILQTFHSKGVYQGCAIVPDKDTMSPVDGDEEATQTRLISLTVKEVKMKRFLDINFYYQEKKGKGSILIEKISIQDRSRIRRLQQILSKKRTAVGFRISTDNFKIVSTYLVSPKYHEELKEKLQGDRYATIHVMNQDFLEDSERLSAYLREQILDYRIRAITLCDVELPVEYWKELRLLYVFNYDMEHGKFSCIKTN